MRLAVVHNNLGVILAGMPGVVLILRLAVALDLNFNTLKSRERRASSATARI